MADNRRASADVGEGTATSASDQAAFRFTFPNLPVTTF